MTDEEMREAVLWMNEHRRDEDVASAQIEIMVRLDCSSLSKLVDNHPEEYYALYEGLRSMVEEIPDSELLR